MRKPKFEEKDVFTNINDKIFSSWKVEGKPESIVLMELWDFIYEFCRVHGDKLKYLGLSTHDIKKILKKSIAKGYTALKVPFTFFNTQEKSDVAARRETFNSIVAFMKKKGYANFYIEQDNLIFWKPEVNVDK